MKIDDKGQVLYFNEKPRGADLESMVRLALNSWSLIEFRAISLIEDS